MSPPRASANGTYWPSRMSWSKPYVCRRYGTVNDVCVSTGGGSRSPRPPADVTADVLGINHRKQDVHSPHWCASPRVPPTCDCRRRRINRSKTARVRAVLIGAPVPPT